MTGVDPNKDRVRQFILTNFYVSDPSVLTDETSLLRQGIVDSTGVLEVITFLEAEFSIQVLDEEMLPENLDSISRIAAYLAHKTAANRSPADRAACA
jgi:acyl carrier protein